MKPSYREMARYQGYQVQSDVLKGRQHHTVQTSLGNAHVFFSTCASGQGPMDGAIQNESQCYSSIASTYGDECSHQADS